VLRHFTFRVMLEIDSEGCLGDALIALAVGYRANGLGCQQPRMFACTLDGASHEHLCASSCALFDRRFELHERKLESSSMLSLQIVALFTNNGDWQISSDTKER
jgi:hypothetical protein